MNGNEQIYSKADYETLLRAKQQLREVAVLIDRARNCEINCDVANAIHDEMARKLEKLEREFFSDPSQLT